MIGFIGFDSRRGLGIFLFTTASRTALGSTQPPIQWVPGALSLGVKRPGREADRSPPSSAEVKIAWSYTSAPQYVFMAWCLVKHRDTSRVKGPDREADRSPPSSADNKNSWSHISNPPCVFIALCSITHRDNFIFLDCS
jgi:hypothetical protein